MMYQTRKIWRHSKRGFSVQYAYTSSASSNTDLETLPLTAFLWEPAQTTPNAEPPTGGGGTVVKGPRHGVKGPWKGPERALLAVKGFIRWHNGRVTLKRAFSILIFFTKKQTNTLDSAVELLFSLKKQLQNVVTGSYV